MHLSGLFLYPVKSLRGFAVSSAHVDGLGLIGDRRFLVVDDTGLFLTQRTLPRMALISTALDEHTLTLSADGHGSVIVGRALCPPSGDASTIRTVSVWKSEGLLAEDCGADVSAWLTSFLGVTCHLVRIGEKFRRPIPKPRYALPGDVVTFADAFPFLAIGKASLADLNDRLVAAHEEPVPMNRFRPNLVVTGSAAFAEDTWPRVRIGEIVFRARGPCARCIVTTTDQFTGDRGREPLRTLAAYRRDADDSTRINFGQNLINETKFGLLRLGDPIEILG